eukprot:SAG22_NODE_3094_length_1945_cov_1.432052_4_plen_83_part_00
MAEQRLSARGRRAVVLQRPGAMRASLPAGGGATLQLSYAVHVLLVLCSSSSTGSSYHSSRSSRFSSDPTEDLDRYGIFMPFL